MNDDLGLGKTLGIIVGIGALVGIGKLLASKEVLTWRLALGRVLVSSALSVAAGAVLAFLPDINDLAVIGMSAAFAVLGEQGLEKWLAAKTGTQG